MHTLFTSCWYAKNTLKEKKKEAPERKGLFGSQFKGTRPHDGEMEAGT